MKKIIFCFFLFASGHNMPLCAQFGSQASFNGAYAIFNSDEMLINQMISKSPLERAEYEKFEKDVTSNMSRASEIIKSNMRSMRQSEIVNVQQRMADVYLKTQKVTCKNCQGNEPAGNTSGSAGSIGQTADNTTFVSTPNYAAESVLSKGKEYEEMYRGRIIKLLNKNGINTGDVKSIVKNNATTDELSFDNVKTDNSPQENKISDTKELTNYLSGKKIPDDERKEIESINNVVNDPGAAVSLHDFLNKSEQPANIGTGIETTKILENYFDNSNTDQYYDLSAEMKTGKSKEEKGDADKVVSDDDLNLFKKVNKLTMGRKRAAQVDENLKNIGKVSNDAVANFGEADNLEKVSEDIDEYLKPSSRIPQPIRKAYENIKENIAIPTLSKVVQFTSDHPYLTTGALTLINPTLGAGFIMGKVGDQLFSRKMENRGENDDNF